MTGLRNGELVAPRWRDIDWAASRIRVRQNYVRGEFGLPKSKRSTRLVPMADAIGGELDRLSKPRATPGPTTWCSRIRPTSDLSTESAAMRRRRPHDCFRPWGPHEVTIPLATERSSRARSGPSRHRTAGSSPLQSQVVRRIGDECDPAEARLPACGGRRGIDVAAPSQQRSRRRGCRSARKGAV